MSKTQLTLTAIFSVVTALIPVSPVFAQNTDSGTIRTAVGAARLSTLVQRCDLEIANRLTTLSNMSSRLAGLQKLSDSQKTEFQNQIQAASSGLTSLKAKCDSETDLSALRTELREVFTVFRIYAVQAPQIHLLAAADTLDTTLDRLTELVNLLTTRIQQVGSPNNLTTLLADMSAKIVDARAQYSTIKNSVTTLAPTSFNTDPVGTKTILTNARADLKAGSVDIKSALSDARQIRQGLIGLKVVVSPTTAPSN